MSDASLEAAIGGICASGCGCSRHPARVIYGKAAVGREGEELLTLYRKLEPHLHSYCSTTRSSSTSSSRDIVEKIFDIALGRLTAAEPERVLEAVETCRYIARTGRGDTSRKLEKELGEAVKSKIPVIASSGRYRTALALLEYECRSCDAEATVMAALYFPKAVKELKAATEEKKLEEFLGMAISAERSDLESRARKAIASLNGSKPADKTLLQRIRSFAGTFHDTCSSERRGAERTKKEEYEKIERPYLGAIKPIEEKIATLERVKRRLPECEHAEHASLDRELESHKAKLKGEEERFTGQKTELERPLRELDLKSEEFSDYVDRAVSKIKGRTMTKEEYRTLSQKMRKSEKDFARYLKWRRGD
ncbi:hypothetical protein HY495_02900 [Candidatus Woesearchaeota archaeon]|nr:hypothetical protein [Candidatus Woesearchaeota archaeon]